MPKFCKFIGSRFYGSLAFYSVVSTKPLASADYYNDTFGSPVVSSLNVASITEVVFHVVLRYAGAPAGFQARVGKDLFDKVRREAPKFFF